MPVSYDTSSLLKCTVSFSYTRYYIDYINSSNDANTSKAAKTMANPFTGAQLDAIEAADIDYTQALKSGNNDRIEAADIGVTQLRNSIGAPYPIFQRLY